MSSNFNLVDAVTATKPGAIKNEDSYFFLRHACVVMDGATGLSGPVIAADSDGHWFVNQVQFHAQSCATDELEIPLIVRNALALTCHDLEKVEGAANLPAYATPSASFVAIGVSKGALRAYRLGDCQMYRLRGAGLERLFEPSPLESLDDRSIAALQAELRKGLASDEARTRILPMLRKHRALMNTEGGYGVLSPQESCLSYLEISDAAFAPGDYVLLATDGFMAGADRYGVFDLYEAVEIMKRRAAADLIARIREVEVRDDKLAEHPRLKQHDDATAVLIEIV
jgi:serine/threonine protein phosphatase PrpC